MTPIDTRRRFLRQLGLGAAVAPFVSNLPSLAGTDSPRRKQRLVIMFSPNGVPPAAFWPSAVRHSVSTLNRPSDRHRLVGVGGQVGGGGGGGGGELRHVSVKR